MDWEVHIGWILLLYSICTSSVTGVQQITNPRIVENPEDQYVAKNEPATLNCKAEGDPPPIITWYRNGRPVITANENPSSHRMLLPSGQLFFLRIIHNKHNKPDVGVYYCNATNSETKVSVVSRNASLDIAALRDDFKEMPQNTDVAVGDTAILECRPPKGLPDPRVKWKRDGDTLALNSRVSIQTEGSLMISDARKSDSGMYTCVAANIAGEKETPAARLSVLEKPTLIQPPLDVQEDANSDIRFECEASGDPAPTIIWKREDGGQIPPGRSHVGKDRSLKIDKIKVTDEGNYICRAENVVGYVEATARLSVHSQPSFIVTPKDKTVGVGRRVSLKCEVTGNPPPAVFWNRDTDQNLMFPRQDHGRFSVSDDGTLIIEPVRKSDAGEYVCQAYSVAGSALAKARLEVKDVDPRPPPIIHQGPQNQTLPINSVAMLQCSSSGEPMPTIGWMKNNRPLPSHDARIALLDSGTLQISDLKQSDTGIYTCKATSETGDTTWSAALLVEVPTNPSVIFHRTPEPSTFPGPPSMPSVSDISETSMRLSWKSNSNHGASPVFAYTVEYFSHETGEGWIVAADSISEQRYTVHNLRQDTAYMFLVRAQNGHGLSMPSQVTAPIRTKGGSGGGRGRNNPPVQQYDIAMVSEKLTGTVVHMRKADVISSTAIKINWEVKKSLKYIEGFHIKYRVMPDITDHEHRKNHQHHHHIEYTIVTVTDPSATMYVLRNMKKYQWYEIRIQPFYLSVEGQDSNTVRVQTFEDVPSAPPMKISSTLMENDTMLLQWKPPPSEHHNGMLKGFRIYMYGNESKFNRQITTNASSTQLTVNHLVPGMSYRIQMQAFNKMGNGVKSDPHIVGGEKTMAPGFTKQPWFIATIIGTVGGAFWVALCIFSVWLYRKKKARKKMNKNGSMSVPVHKSDDPSRLGNYFGTLNAPNYLQKDIANHVGSMQPDVTNVNPDTKEDEYKENLYNTPNVNPLPAMKTFNKQSHPPGPVSPYATTTLLQNNLINQGNPESAFRPIQHNSGYPQPGSGSSDSCQKQDISISSDSNNENHLINPNFQEPVYFVTEKPTDTCDQCGDHIHSPISECESMMDDPRYPLMGMPNVGPNPMLFLPPPPEQPPPSDIGTPPDSPTCQQRNILERYQINPHRHATPSQVYSDSEQMRALQNQYQMAAAAAAGQRGSHTCGRQPIAGVAPNTTQQPGAPMPGDDPNRFRTMSPRMHAEVRAYSPRAMSEPERGPTPPVRAYKLVPIRDCEPPRHYSDTEGAPVPPMRMMGVGGTHSPPSPAPEDPMMDRGIQSSLPSIAAHPEHIHRGGVGGGAESPVSEYDPGLQHHDEEDDEEYVGESDLESQQNQDCDVDSNVAASWASDAASEDGNCSSVRSSLASSSDGSFFAEADFASAVAKAAELSGLTVVGSTVSDPNAGLKEKEKKYRKHRERAKQRERPSSPYSTDSNYSSVQPRNPYPKSERKKQLHGKGSSRPPVKAKPQQMSDMPNFRPSFSPGLGNVNHPVAKPRNLQNGNSEPTIRTNPLAAFDTSDTPIV